MPRWAWALPFAVAVLAVLARGDATTYAQFHVGFTLPWLAVLAWDAALAVRAGRPLGGAGERGGGLALGVLVAVAFAYTFPWDHQLVARGVWGYPEGRVLATLGVVPVEEAAFFVVQTLAVGLATLAWSRRLPVPEARRRPAHRPAVRLSVVRWGVAAAMLGTAAAGLLLLPTEPGTYLGMILVWAAPILALQWAFGGDLLAARARLFGLAVGLPTLWLWVADRLALEWSIWWIAPGLTLGWRPLGLPVEEAVFFLATNLLVVGGVRLAVDPRSVARLRELVRASVRRPWRPLLALWAIAMVPTPLLPGQFVPLAYLSTVALAAAVLAFALARYGRRAWAVLAVALVFGWAVEVLGSRTGIPFGAYAYTAPGPALFGVPLLVPVGWFAFSLIALAVVPGRWARWGAPAALVAWDLGLDPLMVREGFWVFERGAYFGVAWTNFLGWYVAGFVLVALLQRVEPRVVLEDAPDLRATYLAQAFLIGVGLAFFELPLAGAIATAAMLAMWAIGRSARLVGARGPGR